MSRKDFFLFSLYSIFALFLLWGSLSHDVSPYGFYRPGWKYVKGFYRKSVGTAADLRRFFISRRRLTHRLDKLSGRHDELERRLQKLKLLKYQNKRFRKQLDLPPSPRGHLRAAQAFSQNFTGLERTMRINRGYHSGVQEGHPVLEMVNDTLVLRGKVYQVFAEHSLVVLPGDPRFKVGVKIESVPGRQFVLEGQGHRQLVIENFPSVLEVNPGDRVYTASASLIAPRDILVGKIGNVLREDDAARIGNQLRLAPVAYETFPRLVWVLIWND